MFSFFRSDLTSGLDYQNVVAGETFNIFLLAAISNRNIFLIKKKNNVVVTSTIYDYFASKILTYNVKKNITQTFYQKPTQ